jgi:MMP 1-O-methyltransferase
MARVAAARRPEVPGPPTLARWLRPGLPVLSLERIAPRALVGLPVLFNLWSLRSEISVVQNLNDSHLHFAMLRWARSQIVEGKVPLDGWFPYLGLGSTQFRHYSVLPHILAALVSLVTDAATTYFWSLYLLLALWPVSVYLGARLLGWDRWTAASAAVVAPLLVSATNYGYERGSYTWYGIGLWAQLWGMWLLPLALGLTWRAVSGRGFYVLGALFVALTVASHFLTGYLALLAVGLWALLTPSQLAPRLARSFVVYGGSLLAAAWAIVPIFQDSQWLISTEYGRSSTFGDSFGAQKVLGWLFTGQLYDFGRPAIVTFLVGAGLVVCLATFRHDERARAAVALWLVSLILLFGRPTLGHLVDLLPASGFLPLPRFIIGLHMGGVFLAGIGAAWLGRRMILLTRRFLPRVRPALAGAAALILGVGALYPGWSQVAAADDGAATARLYQQLQESTDGADLQVLIDRIRMLGPGRVYAGSRWDWGQAYTIGYAPVYAVLSNEDIDAVGFRQRVSSLMSDAEMLFDERNPADYDLFNVRYLILPSDRPPPIQAKLILRQGRHTLWEAQTSGYLEVVDTTWPPIVEDHASIASHAVSFLESQQVARHEYPTVAFNGADAAAPSLMPGVVPQGPAGRVEHQVSSPADGTFKGEIVANRVAVVLLKASYDPRWRVIVDGVQMKPDMIAPALMGRTVPVGRHSVTFQYVPDPEYPLLLTLGFLGLLGLGLAPRLVRPSLSARRIFGRLRSVGSSSMRTLWASEYRRRLNDALRDVEGFMGLEEAWELHEVARSYPPMSEPLNVVEIGSWKGRSTIALALGVQHRGNGIVHAIDPHTGSRELIEIYGRVNTYGSFLWNVERAGVANVVIPIRDESHEARRGFSDKSVHVLFVDGSHEYEDVKQDIGDWVSALTDRATVSFNDPSAKGVYRALRESVLSFRGPFRSPKLVQNSLFFDFERNRAWAVRDSVAWLRLRTALVLRYQANRFRPHMPLWLVRIGWSLSRRMVGG